MTGGKHINTYSISIGSSTSINQIILKILISNLLLQLIDCAFLIKITQNYSVIFIYFLSSLLITHVYDRNSSSPIGQIPVLDNLFKNRYEKNVCGEDNIII